MATLVTGATGFIGGKLAEALVQRGEPVRALVRRSSKVEHLVALGVELAYGDVTDAQSVAAAIQGCDRLYHVAAIYEWWLPDRKEFFRVNVDGTRNVLLAALEAGVGKVVYTSTAVTLGESRGEIGTENTRHRGYFLTDYERSKYAAEKTALDIASQGLPLVCVNPSGVYGPGDLKQTGLMIIDYLNGKLPALFDARINMVFVHDVVNGHFRAMDIGRPGDRYILAGDENTAFMSVIQIVQEITGYRKVPPRIPLGMTGVLALGYEAVAMIDRKPPLVSKDFARFARHNSFWADNTKAKSELGITFTPLREGLARTIAWYRDNGYIAAKQ